MILSAFLNSYDGANRFLYHHASLLLKNLCEHPPVMTLLKGKEYVVMRLSE